MKAYWQTLGPPTGVALRVADAARPAWRVEGAGARRRVLRIAGAPRWWMACDAYGEGHEVVRDARFAEARCSPVPPVTALTARTAGDRGAGLSWDLAWARWFARALIDAPISVLYAGDWQLRRTRDPGAPPFEFMSTPPACPEDFDVTRLLRRVRLPRTESLHSDAFWVSFAGAAIVPVRRLSGADVGRVKALRKQARDGTLPPVLLAVETMLGAFPVLDGHVRLVAAMEEGQAPACLALLPVYTVPRRAPHPEAADALANMLARDDLDAATRASANRAYAAAHDDAPVARVRTRVYPFAGGVSAWEREAGAEVAARFAE